MHCIPWGWKASKACGQFVHHVVCHRQRWEMGVWKRWEPRIKKRVLVAIVTRDSHMLSRYRNCILYTLTRVSSLEFSLITISYWIQIRWQVHSSKISTRKQLDKDGSPGDGIGLAAPQVSSGSEMVETVLLIVWVLTFHNFSYIISYM